MSFQVRNLIKAEEIDRAEELLYKVYIQNLNWKFDPKNPSGIKVVTKNNVPYLTDNFRSHGYWMGVFNEEKLVACARLLGEKNGKLEMEHYRSLPEFLQGQHNNVELNRVTVDQAYMNTSAFLALIQAVVQYLQNTQYKHMIASVNFPEPGGLCLKLGMSRLNSFFKYSDQDAYEVDVVYLKLEDKEQLIKIDNLIELLYS
jgi:hypothetical protein